MPPHREFRHLVCGVYDRHWVGCLETTIARHPSQRGSHARHVIFRPEAFSVRDNAAVPRLWRPDTDTAGFSGVETHAGAAGRETGSAACASSGARVQARSDFIFRPSYPPVAAAASPSTVQRSLRLKPPDFFRPLLWTRGHACKNIKTSKRPLAPIEHRIPQTCGVDSFNGPVERHHCAETTGSETGKRCSTTSTECLASQRRRSFASTWSEVG